MKAYLRFPATDFHSPGMLPAPFAARRAEDGLQGLSAHRKRKRTRPFIVSPGRRPVVGPHPDIPEALFQLHRGCRILHRHTHSVCNQIGRTHLIHKLLIDTPAALLRETFCLDKHELSLICTGSVISTSKCRDTEKSSQHNYPHISFHILINDYQFYLSPARCRYLRP